MQGAVEFTDGRQRHHHHRRQRLDDRIACTAVEIERGAGEIRAVQRRVEEHMPQWPRVQQQAGGGDLQLARDAVRVRVLYLHLALAQDVQEGAPRLRFEHVPSAQWAGMEQRCLHPEPFEQGRQPVGHIVGRWDWGQCGDHG
ncbi:hypothetical protein D3C72_1538380 [compost metagenome]